MDGPENVGHVFVGHAAGLEVIDVKHGQTVVNVAVERPVSPRVEVHQLRDEV